MPENMPTKVAKKSPALAPRAPTKKVVRPTVARAPKGATPAHPVVVATPGAECALLPSVDAPGDTVETPPATCLAPLAVPHAVSSVPADKLVPGVTYWVVRDRECDEVPVLGGAWFDTVQGKYLLTKNGIAYFDHGRTADARFLIIAPIKGEVGAYPNTDLGAQGAEIEALERSREWSEAYAAADYRHAQVVAMALTDDTTFGVCVPKCDEALLWDTLQEVVKYLPSTYVAPATKKLSRDRLVIEVVRARSALAKASDDAGRVTIRDVLAATYEARAALVATWGEEFFDRAHIPREVSAT